MKTPPVDFPIEDTSAFISLVLRNKPDEAYEWFYRGHSDREYKLKPYLFRQPEYRANEDRLFRELQVLNPRDFCEDLTTLDALVRMQHHSLPTRLLDITSNPLMALYFACKSHGNRIGQVIAFKIRRNKIKFYDSDTASCIANLAKLSSENRAELSQWIENNPFNTSSTDKEWETHRDKFNKLESSGRLLHFIKEEKSYFLPIIEPEHIKSVICVRTRFTNSRITSQVGASFLFGLDASLPEIGDGEITLNRVSIKAEAKVKILVELDSFNTNESTVFPYIETSAKYLAAKYLKTKGP